jgi:hypothetical protein
VLCCDCGQALYCAHYGYPGFQGLNLLKKDEEAENDMKEPYIYVSTPLLFLSSTFFVIHLFGLYSFVCCVLCVCE